MLKKANLNTVFLLVILIITFLIFSNTLHHNFLNWDDDKQITNNGLIKKINNSTFTNLYSFDKHTTLSLFSFAINYHFGKLNPFGYHLVNILIHLINIILVYLLVLKISNNKIVTFISVILFAWHPMRVESVVWISERKDLLFVCFSLTALLFYIKYLKNISQAYLFYIVIIFVWFASLSKIQSVTLPIVFLTLDILYKRKINLFLIFEKILFFYVIFLFDLLPSHEPVHQIFRLLLLLLSYYILCRIEKNFLSVKYSVLLTIIFIIFGIISKVKFIFFPLGIWFLYNNIQINLTKYKTLFYQYKKYIAIFLVLISFSLILLYHTYSYSFGFWHNSVQSSMSFSFINRFFLAGYALLFYIYKVFIPINLTAIHPYPVINNGCLPIIYYICSICTFLLLIFFSWVLILKQKKIKSEYLFWSFFFLLNISVVLHIIPIEGRLVVADRYSYFAYIGLFVLIGYIFEYFHNKKLYKSFIKYLFLLIAILLAGLTVKRNMVWKNNYTLFNDILYKNSNIYFANWNLGNAFLDDQNFSNAILYFNRAILLKPEAEDISNILSSRGWAKFNSNDTAGSIKDYIESIKLNPKNATAHNNLGWAYLCNHNYDNSFSELTKAIQLDSTMFLAWVNRGILNNATANFQNAIFDFNKALQYNPEYYFAYNNIGWAYYNLKRYDDAIKNYNLSISMNKEFELCYFNRGQAKLITKDYNGALFDFELSIKLNPQRIYNYYYCGWAFLNLNMQKQACSYWDYSLRSGCIEAKKAIQDYCN